MRLRFFFRRLRLGARIALRPAYTRRLARGHWQAPDWIEVDKGISQDFNAAGLGPSAPVPAARTD